MVFIDDVLHGRRIHQAPDAITHPTSCIQGFDINRMVFLITVYTKYRSLCLIIKGTSIDVYKRQVLSALSLKFSVENPWFWASNRDGLDVDRLYESTNSTVFYSGKQPTYYTFTLNVKF